MNYAALKRGAAVAGVFWTGFFFGAHKYHLLYYLPPLLNPQLRCVKPLDNRGDAGQKMGYREVYYA